MQTKVSKSMQNREKDILYGQIINYVVMKDMGITEGGENEWWTERNSESCYVGSFYACLPMLFPHCKNQLWSLSKLIFIKGVFSLSLIYCLPSYLTKDVHSIVIIPKLMDFPDAVLLV